MSNQYTPELGQAVFGNAYGECQMPEDLEDYASDQLRELTRLIEAAGAEVAHGLLGGEHGYGGDFVCSAFEMHPYWWGDCTCDFDGRDDAWWSAHAHADHCYQTSLKAIAGDGKTYRTPTDAELRALCIKHDLLWDGGSGSMVHCTCGLDAEYAAWRSANDHAHDCREVLPNFRCGDIEIRWYKYIGRGMSVNRPVTRRELVKAFAKCRQALKGGEDRG